MPIDPNQVQWDETPQIKAEEVQWEERPESKKTEQSQEPEKEFKDKMLEYGKKLAYDLGMIPRWGVEGVAQAIGTFTDPFGEMAAKAMGREYQPLQEYAAEKLTQLGVPEEVERYKKPGQIMKTVTAAGATGLGAGQIAKTVSGLPRQVATQLAAQPGAQLVGAATGEAARQKAEEAGAGPLAQLGATIAGGVLGAGATQIPKTRLAPKNIPAGMKEAERAGTRVLTEDVIQPETPGGKVVQSALGKIAGGSGSQRAAQQSERVKMAQNFVREFGADVAPEEADAFLGDVYNELAKKRKFHFKKWNKLKTDVITKLDDQGPMPVEKTMAKIDEEIAALKKFDDTNPLIEFYEDFKNKLQNKSIGSIEELRADLGDNITAAAKDPTKGINKRRGDKIAKKIYRKLNEDMGAFIKDKGEPKDFNKWKAGNKKLSNMIKELEVGALKRTLNNGEATPETVKTMLFSKNPSEARLLYRNLTPKGKKNAQAALIQEALWRTSKGRIEELKPDIFKNKIRDLQRQTGAFFHGEDRQKLQGLYNALKITEGAGKAVNVSPTGMQNLPLLVMTIFGAGGGAGGAALGGPVGAAIGAVAAPVAVGTLSKAYNSKPVRDALLQLSRLKISDPEAAKAAKRLISALQAQQNKQEEKPQ